MYKKYLPYLILLAAGTLLWFVKTKQRGQTTPVTPEQISIEPKTNNLPFSRNLQIVYSKHARCRMECRFIDESEVKEIIEAGSINNDKIETDERGTTYPLEGVTHDQQHVRIVVAPKAQELFIVTVIDLDKDWTCNCK
jgi:hypothetical protein